MDGTKVVKRRRIGALGAFISLAAIYAVSSAPIPLYSLYRENIGLSNADLSFSSGLYFVGTLVALLFMARLSDFRGRRPVSLGTLGLSAAGCLVFGSLSSGDMFLAGRFLQGLSCGIGSSCLAAYLVDTAGEKSGAAAVASAPMAGMAAGSFGSGLLVQYGTGEPEAVFVILAAMLVICAVLIMAGKETMPRRAGAIQSLRPQIAVPKKIRPYLPAAVAVFVGTWGIGGFYQAFSAPMAAECLHSSNVVMAAAVFACLQAPNIIGSMAAKKMPTKRAQRLGMTLFLLGVAVMIFTLFEGAAFPFLAVSAFVGASWGLAYTGSLQSMVQSTGQMERAGVLSTACLISYGGAAVPSMAVGSLGSSFSLYEIAIGYGVLVFVAWLLACMLSKGNESMEPDSMPKQQTA